ncbi:MAG: FkbM family methyltransferase [Bryobacteraceae bacterium]
MTPRNPVVEFGKALLRVTSKLAGNQWCQSLLEKALPAAQYLQGIGSGEDVASSGETALISKAVHAARSDGRKLCIFDVGANTGQFLTLACEALKGRQFSLYSFEPGAEAFRRLSETARKHANVTLNNFGLGRERGEQELFYDAAGSALASLTKRRLAHFGIEMGVSEKVRIETLDDYCRLAGIEYIDLLKLDVEGHELDVLNGASQMFRDSRIGMVTFEFGGCNIDTRTFVQDFFYFFADQKMRIARITPSGYFYELRSYSEILEQFRTSNFVCYRP